VRNCDEFQVKKSHVENILKWEENQRLEGGVEVPFKPARVILQDLTGVRIILEIALGNNFALCNFLYLCTYPTVPTENDNIYN
jgi:Aconitase A